MLQKIRIALTIVFFTILPFQTRWIYSDSPIDPAAEWGRLSLYGSELVLGALLVLALAEAWKKRGKIKKAAKRKKSWWYWVALVFILYLFRYALFHGFISLQAITWILLATATVIFVFSGWMPKRAVLHGVYIGLLLAALMGIFQVIDQSVIANKWLGLAQHLPQEGGAAVVEYGNTRFLRAYGPLPHPNIFGGYMAIALILSLYACLQTEFCKKKLAALVIASSVALTLSFSRGAWLAAAIGIGILIIKHKKNIVRPLLLAALPILITVSMTWPVVQTRISGQQRLEERSLQERGASLKDGWLLLQDHPITGVGIGMSALILGEGYIDQWWQIAPPHNILLVIALEIGVVGLILVGLLVVPLLKKFEFNLVAFPLLVAGMFDHYLWTLYPGVMLVALSAAIIIALSPQRPHALHN